MQLRFATTDDVGGIQEIYAPVVERTAISFETVPPSEAELARRIEETMPDYPWLVATEHGDVVGYAYGHRFAERAAYSLSVETSIYVHETARGSGIGRALYTALLSLLTAQGYQQAFAGIALPNPASVALHEALGFRRIGTYERVGFKFDEWHDVGWWQRPLTNGTTSPASPVATDELDAAVVERVLCQPG